ncbi:DNA mismatch repair protein MutS [Altererythrobacter luteolus]|uniref:DNA mismatch repair protein MutS n=1 Tax=Pontixanthobacter luteolus TaxID=295089 RepID=A0A6I4V2L6_9SPHN|nr:DNA mismatch repair protein MutS [Pontixanthobacter luteolus]
MRLPRGLTADEEAAWAKLASSVEPFEGRRAPKVEPSKKVAPQAPVIPKRAAVKPAPTPKIPTPATQPPPRSARRIGGSSLDSHWDRKLKAGSIAPDFTLDLHDHYVDAAHTRLDSGMHQARSMGARLVLVITGRPRPVEAADRGSKRGVIRAKILDWLAAGDHADAIAAIRKAHRRHGGEGALYVVLRKNR